jgi:hypothetical protein
MKLNNVVVELDESGERAVRAIIIDFGTARFFKDTWVFDRCVGKLWDWHMELSTLCVLPEHSLRHMLAPPSTTLHFVCVCVQC